jgi:hypothetical protein
MPKHSVKYTLEVFPDKDKAWNDMVTAEGAGVQAEAISKLTIKANQGKHGPWNATPAGATSKGHAYDLGAPSSIEKELGGDKVQRVQKPGNVDDESKWMVSGDRHIILGHILNSAETSIVKKTYTIDIGTDDYTLTVSLLARGEVTTS